MTKPIKRAQVLPPKTILRVLKTCEIMQSPELKRCAVALSHAAMRVTECALVDVKTVLKPTGEIRTEVFLPAAICKNLKPRTIWLANESTRAIVQEWVSYRIKRKWGLSLESRLYQGLNPDSKLLFNNRGRPYSIQPKPRQLEDGTIKIYWACDALEAMLRKVYKRCGLGKASSHSGRRSFVSNAVLRGVDLETLAVVLGHSHPETTLGYFDVCPKRLAEMCSFALDE